jgi:hypothetical protein
LPAIVVPGGIPQFSYQKKSSFADDLQMIIGLKLENKSILAVCVFEKNYNFDRISFSLF